MRKVKHISTSKKGMVIGLGAIVVVLIVAVAAIMVFKGNGGSNPSLNIQLQQQPNNPNPNPNVNQGICAKEDTTWTLSGIDQYDSSIAVLGNHQYRTDGKWLSLADAASATLDTNQQVRFAVGNGNKSGTGPFFWTVISSDNTECRGEKTTTVTALRNGTMSIRTFNEDDGQLNSAANNETLAAGDVVNLAGDLESQFERAAAPYGGVAVCEYNSSAYDDCIVNFNGRAVNGNLPSFYTVTNTGHQTKTYKFPATNSLGKISKTIVLDADDTNNPLLGYFGAGANVRVTYYPYDYFLNTDTNDYELGVQDQNGNRLTNRPAYIEEVIVD